MDLVDEFEPEEWRLASTPLGELPMRERIRMSWRTESAVVLAWALQRYELQPYDQQASGPEVGEAIGFLDDDAAGDLIRAPELRSEDKLHWYANLALMVHWRLREFHRASQPIDFLTLARECRWAHMPIDDVELIEGDLALRRTAVSKLPKREFDECRSIAMERHHAANWLIGTEEVYSQVTCDT